MSNKSSIDLPTIQIIIMYIHIIRTIETLVNLTLFVQIRQVKSVIINRNTRLKCQRFQVSEQACSIFIALSSSSVSHIIINVYSYNNDFRSHFRYIYIVCTLYVQRQQKSCCTIYIYYITTP